MERCALGWAGLQWILGAVRLALAAKTRQAQSALPRFIAAAPRTTGVHKEGDGNSVFR
jgi:hypothetical protein